MKISSGYSFYDATPQDCSYFEAQCWLSEFGIRKEDRDAAKLEVHRMVQANNDALAQEQRRALSAVQPTPAPAPAPSNGNYQFTQHGTSAGGGFVSANTIGPNTIGPITITGSNPYISSGSTGITVATNLPATSKLSKITFSDRDEHGNSVHLTLSVERTVTPYEVMLLVQMIETLRQPNNFSPLMFVRENNLERHFTFS